MGNMIFYVDGERERWWHGASSFLLQKKEDYVSTDHQFTLKYSSCRELSLSLRKSATFEYLIDVQPFSTDCPDGIDPASTYWSYSFSLPRSIAEGEYLFSLNRKSNYYTYDVKRRVTSFVFSDDSRKEDSTDSITYHIANMDTTPVDKTNFKNFVLNKSFVTYQRTYLFENDQQKDHSEAVSNGFYNHLDFTETLAPERLFNHYDKLANSPWKTIPWLNGLDFTGIAWDDRKAGTLISPQHIVFAKHWRRGLNSYVYFHDKDGNSHKRQIIKRANVDTSDITIAKLDSPLPSSVKYYKVLSHKVFLNKSTPLLITNQSYQVCPSTLYNPNKSYSISTGSEIVIDSNYSIGYTTGSINRPLSAIQNPNSPNCHSNIRVGDSGHPGFYVINGELVLALTHSSVGSGANYGDYRIQTILKGLIESM